MDWIEIQLKKLRQRHQQKSKQLSQQNVSKKQLNQTPAANSNMKKAKAQSKEVIATLKKHQPSKAQPVTKNNAPSSGGSKPARSYQPKGLPPRANSRGKGRSR